MDNMIDLRETCHCGAKGSHRQQTFTNVKTGAPVPALVCETPGCFFWRAA